MLKSAKGFVLVEFEDGLMIYQPDRDRVHYLNQAAALVFELCRGGNSPATITELLGEAYGLTQPPGEPVKRVMKSMLSEALVPACGEGESDQVSLESRMSTEEKLLASVTPEGKSLVKRMLAKKRYVIPAIESFPIDGLSVSSAKCSARWANLEDNTCYTRSDPVSGRTDG
jgi:hypothetical protein